MLVFKAVGEGFKPSPTTPVGSAYALSGDGYFSDCQPCFDAVTNEAQSSGGFPRVSILAKTVYGSDLLAEERSVDRSLTHA